MPDEDGDAADDGDGDLGVLDPDERVQIRLSLADGDLVVTDRRAFRLLDGGDAVATIDRGSIASVRTANLRRGHLGRAVTVYVLAMVSLGASVVLSPFSVAFPVDPEAAGRMGTGDVVALFRRVFELLSLVDEALAGLGAVLVLYTVVYVVRAWGRRLVLKRTDGRRVYIGAPSLADDDVERLRELLVE